MFILVRHAHAGDKHQWTGPDAERPLSPRGQQQADGLVHNLSALDAPRLLTSPYLRCRQTLDPLAAHTHALIEDHPLLAPDADPARLDDFLADPALEGAVLCTHGETLSALIRRWRKAGTTTFSSDAPARDDLGENSTEKGAAWVIVDEGPGRTAHYLRPLHVGPVLIDQ